MNGSAPDAFSRRRFLQTSLLVAAASPGMLRGQLETLEWRFFTAKEAGTLGVLADIIMPPDGDPGGAWAGVVTFIDRQLVGHSRRYQALYRGGLAAIEASGVATHGVPLSALGQVQRVALFTQLEKQQLPSEPWQGLSQTEFFNVVVDHTLQGFLGAPRHGGNRDAVSWRMLGLPYPPVRSRRPESPRSEKGAR